VGRETQNLVKMRLILSTDKYDLVIVSSEIVLIQIKPNNINI